MSGPDNRLLVASHVLDGKSARAISTETGLSQSAVRGHISRMLADHGAANRAGLINKMYVPGERTALPPLPPALADIARRLIDGQSQPCIAKARGTKASTVKTQAHALLKRLGVRSYTELAAQYEAR